MHRDGFRRHVRWGHDPADRQFVDQGPSHDRQRDVGLVHRDVLLGHQDAGRYDQGWMRRNGPYGPKRRGVARHQGVDHESPGLVGDVQAVVERGEPNAHTRIEPLGGGRYRLTPRTGRTHQLRIHMAGLGLPIDNDPLYPEVVDVDPGDFSRPLRLIAQRLEFDDPLTGERRCFVSSRA